jgi:hypothetical protein
MDAVKIDQREGLAMGTVPRWCIRRANVPGSSRTERLVLGMLRSRDNSLLQLWVARAAPGVSIDPPAKVQRHHFIEDPGNRPVRLNQCDRGAQSARFGVWVVHYGANRIVARFASAVYDTRLCGASANGISKHTTTLVIEGAAHEDSGCT